MDGGTEIRLATHIDDQVDQRVHISQIDWREDELDKTFTIILLSKLREKAKRQVMLYNALLAALMARARIRWRAGCAPLAVTPNPLASRFISPAQYLERIPYSPPVLMTDVVENLVVDTEDVEDLEVGIFPGDLEALRMDDGTM